MILMPPTIMQHRGRGQSSNVRYISEIKTFMVNGKPIKESELSQIERNQYLSQAKPGSLLTGNSPTQKKRTIIL